MYLDIQEHKYKHLGNIFALFTDLFLKLMFKIF